mgnify:CR=1 FL=1
MRLDKMTVKLQEALQEALAAGASTVMLGSMLAGTEGIPGPTPASLKATRLQSKFACVWTTSGLPDVRFRGRHTGSAGLQPARGAVTKEIGRLRSGRAGKMPALPVARPRKPRSSQGRGRQIAEFQIGVIT